MLGLRYCTTILVLLAATLFADAYKACHMLRKSTAPVPERVQNGDRWTAQPKSGLPISQTLLFSTLESVDPSREFIAEKLRILDLLNIWRLATKQFAPNCKTVSEELLLTLQILYLFTPKLLVPRFMGHEVIGLKYASSNELVGFVDLSLQQSCGSMDALKSTPLQMRRKIHNNLQPYLCNLLVTAPFRRRGLGRMLVKACEQEALSWGCNTINLHVESFSLPALTLYVSENFDIMQKKDNGLLFMRKSF
jgi:GNAT superfamily N-acetyltransferase